MISFGESAIKLAFFFLLKSGRVVKFCCSIMQFPVFDGVLLFLFCNSVEFGDIWLIINVIRFDLF